ncbi:type I polyketide synthase [Methylocystis sp. 9N]|uniref:Type I polyketide synthase n=1 Tax=Methylocystis borbori TaxID=3118750 RepID=A0ABU7XFW9_9HYPH
MDERNQKLQESGFRADDGGEMEPIAIIGIGCRFPGGANSPDAYWNLLVSGQPAIREVPNDRWSLDRFYNENPEKPNKIYTRKGGFLDEAVHRFDAAFFNISPREAVHVDPQQRLLMEVAWESMEDAGVVPETLAGSETGVYIGGFTLDSMLDQLSPLNRENISMHSGTGALMTLLSNRLSYFFDFRGPSLSVDTACSSSLVAVHLACQDIWRGHASMALAGGVNVMLRPEYPMIMGKGHFLAPDGYCKSFDERANGYSRGEGAGVVLLKPYAAAVRDGDHIYATIRGTGVNQDGRTDGITMPSAVAQEALIRRVYAQSGVPFSNVRYVEAHGTGTPVGDPIEAGVLGRTIGAGRDADEACLIGSAKSTIGHLEAAAGVAGLIKAALCLDRGAVPPQANLQNPNPKIPFQELGIRLATSLEPLSEEDQEVYCGVNSFGFGGTNAHVVLQRIEKPPLEEKKDGSAGEQILLLSGRDPKVLTALARSYAQVLSRGKRAAFEDICHAARIRRSAHECRLSVVAASAAEMATELEQFAAHGYSDHVVQGKSARRAESRPVFVFTGMGPQWWGMGRQLLESEPVFRKAAEEIDELFRKLAGFSILDEMREDKSRSRVKETRIAQPANFVVQVALAELLRSWGVYPAAVVGHSVGEVSAAYISGALSLEDAVAVSYHRSRLQQLAAGKGRMLATALNREQAERLIEPYPDTVSIAAINSVSTVTLAGDGEALASIAERLAKDEIFNKFLEVEVAYHSPQMEELKPELRKSLEGIRPQTPHTPLYSTVTGQLVQGPDWGAEYWCSNMREPVLFADAMVAMVNDGLSGFLEVGPHPVLSTSIKEVLRASEAGGVSIATLRREHPERATVLAGLGALYVNGYDVNWRALSPAGARFVKLPLYPWQRELYWNETNAAAIDRLGHTEHPLLGSKVSSPMPTWEHDLGRPSISYLADHVIEGAIVFPGAGYIEQGLAIAALLDEGQASYTLEGLSFLRPLVFPTLKDPIVRATFDRNLREFHIYSQTDDESVSWTLNAMGRVLALPPPRSGTESLAEVKERIGESVDVAELYDRLAAHGLAYGPHFRTIRNLTRNGDEILAELEIIQGPSDELDAYRLHPALLDGAIQTLVGAIGQGELEESTYLPVGVGRVVFHSGAGAPLWAHGRVIDQSSEGFEGDLVLYRADGGVAAEILGIRCKALHTTKLTPKQRLESRSYGLAWEVKPLSEADQQAGDCLLIAANPGSCKDLATALEELGAKVQTIDAQSLTDVAAARKLIDENANPRAIVFLGRSDTNADDAVTDLSDAKRLVRVAQALELQDADDASPRLFVVTLLAQPLPGAQTVNIAHAPLIGLARTIAGEYPHLRCTAVDVDPLDADRGLLARQILSESPETEVALRGDERRVQRLVRASALGEEDGKAEIATVSAASVPAFRLSRGAENRLESLRFDEAARIAPAAGEIEVEIKAAALNFKDVLKVLGMLPAKALEGSYHGAELGMEAAGVVTAVGEGVTAYKVGDELVGSFKGSFSSHVRVPADHVLAMPKPSSLTFEEAASLPVIFMTAYYALHDIARLRAGETVLIHAAAGGVGLAAIQVAKWIGARIFATAGSPAKREYLRTLGVEQVFDSRSLEFADGVLKATEGRGVDVVLNSIAGETFIKSLEVTAPFGRFVEIGKRDIVENGRLPLLPFNKNLLFAAVDLDRLMAEQPQAIRDLLAQIWRRFEKGEFLPAPVTVFPLHEAPDAFRFMAQSKQTGKIVLSFADAARVEVVPAEVEKKLIQPNATYLVTGGFSGFGLNAARWLAQQGAKNLVLVSRSGAASSEAQRAVSALEEQGVNVVSIAADVGVEADVKAMMARISRELPPLRGVVHSAAVLDDTLLSGLTDERFDAVYRPKAIGAWHLHRASLNAPLDFFLGFSSISALIGNPGQGNYVAANMFLDMLAYYRQTLGLPGQSVNWGAIGDVGMVARDKAVAQHLARAGIQPISSKEALEDLGEALLKGTAQFAYVDVDWSKWASTHPASSAPRFSPLVNEARDEADSVIDRVRAELAQIEPEQRGDHVVGILRRVVGETLRIPCERIDIDAQLSEMGIDSLMAVELQVAVKATLGVEISLMELMKGRTVASLGRDLVKRLS